jgi:hypothetical protein
MFFQAKRQTLQFVGLSRGGYGNPFDITTASKRPLAEDVTDSVVTALQKARNSAIAVPAIPKSSVEDARAFLLKAEADRFALLTFRQWKSDAWFSIGLDYEMNLEILSKDGSELARTSISGHDNLGTAVVPKDVRVAAETAIRDKLEIIFNEPAIKSALE